MALAFVAAGVVLGAETPKDGPIGSEIIDEGVTEDGTPYTTTNGSRKLTDEESAYFWSSF